MCYIDITSLALLIELSQFHLIHFIRLGEALFLLMYPESAAEAGSLLVEEQRVAVLVIYRLVSKEVTVRRRVHNVLLDVPFLLTGR